MLPTSTMCTGMPSIVSGSADAWSSRVVRCGVRRHINHQARRRAWFPVTNFDALRHANDAGIAHQLGFVPGAHTSQPVIALEHAPAVADTVGGVIRRGTANRILRPCHRWCQRERAGDDNAETRRAANVFHRLTYSASTCPASTTSTGTPSMFDGSVSFSLNASGASFLLT